MLTSDKEIDKHIILQVAVVYPDPNQYGHIESGSEHFHSISSSEYKELFVLLLSMQNIGDLSMWL